MTKAKQPFVENYSLDLEDFANDFENESLPKKFKDALEFAKNPYSKSFNSFSEKDQTRETAKDDLWNLVRPGETFPQYNLRMKNSRKVFKNEKKMNNFDSNKSAYPNSKEALKKEISSHKKVIQTTESNDKHFHDIKSTRKLHRVEYLRARKARKIDVTKRRTAKKDLREVSKEPAIITARPRALIKDANCSFQKVNEKRTPGLVHSKFRTKRYFE